MIRKKGDFKFGLFAKAVNAKKRDLTTEAANMARNHFIKGFNNEGFTDNTLIKWKRRKKTIKGRKILIGKQGGALRRSILISSISNTKFRLNSQLIYSAVHNEGRRAGRGMGFIMPKRKFMGNSKKMEAATAKRIAKLIELIRRKL